MHFPWNSLDLDNVEGDWSLLIEITWYTDESVDSSTSFIYLFIRLNYLYTKIMLFLLDSKFSNQNDGWN